MDVLKSQGRTASSLVMWKVAGMQANACGRVQKNEVIPMAFINKVDVGSLIVLLPGVRTCVLNSTNAFGMTNKTVYLVCVNGFFILTDV